MVTYSQLVKSATAHAIAARKTTYEFVQSVTLVALHEMQANKHVDVIKQGLSKIFDRADFAANERSMYSKLAIDTARAINKFYPEHALIVRAFQADSVEKAEKEFSSFVQYTIKCLKTSHIKEWADSGEGTAYNTKAAKVKREKEASEKAEQEKAALLKAEQDRLAKAQEQADKAMAKVAKMVEQSATEPVTETETETETNVVDTLADMINSIDDVEILNQLSALIAERHEALAKASKPAKVSKPEQVAA